MAMASYGENNVDIKDSLFVGSDLRNFKLDYKLDTFQEQCNFAKSLQVKCQNRVKNIITESVKRTGCKNVCMSGGYFLNCVSNTFVQKNLPKNIKTFIEPICGDDGISIGLAKLNYYSKTLSKRKFPLKDIYFGKKQDIIVEGKKVSPTDVAHLLADKKVIKKANEYIERKVKQ